MDFMAHFTMGTGGDYITMLPADWSIFTSHDPLPSSCHSDKMLWNPSISAKSIGIGCQQTNIANQIFHKEIVYKSV